MRNQRVVFFFIFLLAFWKSSISIAAVDDTLKRNENSKFLIFPFFLKSPETDWGFGTVSAYFFKAKKDDAKIRTSDINLVTLYTLRNQIVGVLGGNVYFPGEREIIRLQTSYSYYPDKTWGIGNQTNENEKEEYSIKQFYFNPQFLVKVVRNWYAGFTYEFQNIHDFKYTTNGLFDQQLINGRQGGGVSGAGLLVTWDTRNNAFSPTKGLFSELNVTAFDERFGSGYNFTTLTFDLRKFILLKKNRVLAFQFLLKDNTGTVSFRNLSMLGGPEMMRGYYKGRYADKDMWAFQTELRQFLFWRIGVTAFAGMGEVSPGVSLFRLDGLHVAGGAGLRLMVSKSEKLNLRVDYGIGDHSHGLYVILKEAF